MKLTRQDTILNPTRLGVATALKRVVIACSALLGSGLQAAEPELMLYWGFDSTEKYGFVERDLSGRGNDGKLVWERIRHGGGGRYEPGQGVFGGAASVADRGAIILAKPIALPETWTFSFWFKAETIAYAHGLAVLRDPDSRQDLCRFSIEAGGRISVHVAPPGGKAGGLGVALPEDAANRWIPVALTYGGGKIHLAVDGETATIEGDYPQWSPSVPVAISMVSSLGQRHHRFDGMVDEVRLYGGALPEDTVLAMADPKGDFYERETLPPIPDAGLPQTLRLEEKGSVEGVLSGGLGSPGQNAGTVEKVWSVVQAPSAETLRLTDRGDGTAAFAIGASGDYRFRLTTRTSAGETHDEVAVVVFPVHRPLVDGPKMFEREPHKLLPGLPNKEPERAERAAASTGPMPVVAHWTFDKARGRTIPDASGNGHDLKVDSLGEPVPGEGRFEGALPIAIDSHPRRISFGNFEALKDSFSLSFWTKSVREDNRASLFSSPGYWNVGNHSNSGQFAPERGVVTWGATSGPVLWQDWNHVVITYGQQMRKLYVNGVMSEARKWNPLDEGSGVPELVFNSPDSNYGFKGWLDDVTLYSAVLNNEEVGQLYDLKKDSSAMKERLPFDPFMTKGFRKDYAEKHFPELDLKADDAKSRGFAAERFPDRAPAPYVHPRIFFTLEELPEIRKNMTLPMGQRRMSEIRQYLDVALGDALDEEGEYKVTFHSVTNDKGKLELRARNDLDAIMVAESLRCLVDADSEGARRVARWMARTAEVQSEFLDATGPDSDWQQRSHYVLLRMGTAVMYDYLYLWMTDDQRRAVSGVIAKATQNQWAIGMGALPALFAHVSNWQPWVTGEYLLALMSIEGEEGFDPEAYAAAMRAMKNCSLLLADTESGASYEGMGKNLIGASVLAAMSRRLPPMEKTIAGAMPYNHVRKFFLHASVPWGGWMMRDDLLGGIDALRATPCAVLKHAYPDDPLIDYVYHSSAAGRDDYGTTLLTTYGGGEDMTAWTFCPTWDGNDDLAQHLVDAVKATNEPLGYFSNYRGLMIGRSDWTPEATQLYFQPRSIIGGHAMCTRGYFVINALGRNWAPFYGFYNDPSDYHSVVTVDGVGQDTSPGKVLSYHGAAEQPGAQVDIMASDLILPYRQGIAQSISINATRLRPNKEWPWMDLPRRSLVHWHWGDVPYSNPLAPVIEEPKFPFEKAFRTAALVRGEQPYVLIVDDFKKDDQVREYRWNVTIPNDIFKADLVKIDGRDAIYSDPDGQRNLLIRVLAADGFERIETKTTLDYRSKKDPVPRLEVVARTVSPGFKVLLVPFKTGDALPKTRWDGKRLVLEGPKGTTDTWEMQENEQGMSELRRQ